MTPDPLLRFVPTPFRFVPASRPHITIVSNDEALARNLTFLLNESPNLVASFAIASIKLIRDQHAPSDSATITIQRAGPITMLLQGTGTILLHDAESRELIAFLSPHITPFHIIDAAQATARATAALLPNAPKTGTPTCTFYATDSIEKFQRLGTHFLGQPLREVNLLDLGG